MGWASSAIQRQVTGGPGSIVSDGTPADEWPATKELAAQFGVIKAARKAASQGKTRLKASTRESYLHDMKRLKEAFAFSPTYHNFNRLESLFSEYCDVPRTFSKYRSAWIWQEKVAIRDLLTEQDHLQKTKGSFTTWMWIVKRLTGHLDTLGELHALDRESLAEKFGYTTQKTDSKRSSIRDLPPSWRWTMLEKACPGGAQARWYWAYLTLSLSGCRPSELQGAIYSWAGHHLLLQIKGKKVTGKTGQPWRRWQVDLAKLPVEVQSVLRGIKRKELDMFEDQAAVEAFGQHMYRVSKKHFSALKRPISPVSFRHFMVSALRGAEWDKDEIAKIMGHKGESSSGDYGFRGNGTTALGPEIPIIRGTAEAARPVTEQKQSVYLKNNAARNRATMPRPAPF